MEKCHTGSNLQLLRAPKDLRSSASISAKTKSKLITNENIIQQKPYWIWKKKQNGLPIVGTSVPTFRKCISSNKVCQLLSWSHLISSFIQQIYFLVGSLVHTLFRPDLRLVTQPRFHEHVKRSEYFWNFEIWPATVWLRNSVMTVFDLLALD